MWPAASTRNPPPPPCWHSVVVEWSATWATRQRWASAPGGSATKGPVRGRWFPTHALETKRRGPGRTLRPLRSSRTIAVTLRYGADAVLRLIADVTAILLATGGRPCKSGPGGLLHAGRWATQSRSKRCGEPLLQSRFRPPYVRNHRGAVTSPDRG